MNHSKYELLTCIKECPDTFVTTEIIFNVLQNWSYSKLDSILRDLKNDRLINTYIFDEIEKYSISPKGEIFIKDYHSNKSKCKKDFFAGFIYPTILFLISTVLSIILFFLS